MVSALVRRSSGLARKTVLCSWARHFTLTVPLSTQEHKWVPVNCWGNQTNCGGVSCDGLPSHSGEQAEILLAASCNRNRYKLEQPWASRLQGFTILQMLNKISLLFSQICCAQLQSLSVGHHLHGCRHQFLQRHCSPNHLRWTH